MAFEVILDFRAEDQIDQAIQFLFDKNKIASKKLYNLVLETINYLSENPSYIIRYDTFRYLPVKGFPYMFHYSINKSNKIVLIHAIIHTSLNPKK